MSTLECNAVITGSITYDKIAQLYTQQPNLTFLKLQFTYINMFQPLGREIYFWLSKIPTLKHLTLESLDYTPKKVIETLDTAGLHLLGPTLRSLELINIMYDNETLQDICLLLPKLTDLRISEQPSMSINIFTRPGEENSGPHLAKMLSLRHLSLNYFKHMRTRIDDDDNNNEPIMLWSDLFGNLTQIQSLDLRFMECTDIDNLFQELSQKTNIRSLYFSDNNIAKRAKQALPNHISVICTTDPPPFFSSL